MKVSAEQTVAPKLEHRLLERERAVPFDPLQSDACQLPLPAGRHKRRHTTQRNTALANERLHAVGEDLEVPLESARLDDRRQTLLVKRVVKGAA